MGSLHWSVESQPLGHQGSPTTPLLSFQFSKVQVCLGVHAPEESDWALCLQSGGGWSPGEAWSHTSLGPAGSALETGPARVASDAASSLPRPTARNPPWGRSLRTPSLVHTLQSALFPQPSPGARESWPGQGPAPCLDSLWPCLFLFLGLVGALSSSASRHPWAWDSWAPRVQAVASTGDPELSASSCYLFLSLSQSVTVIILFFFFF